MPIYFSSLGVFILTVISVYHSLSGASTSLFQQYILFFSLCIDTQKRGRGKKIDTSEFIFSFSLCHCSFPSLNSWQSSVTDRSRSIFCILKIQMKKYSKQYALYQSRHLENLQDTRKNLEAPWCSNKATNLFPLSTLVPFVKHL